MKFFSYKIFLRCWEKRILFPTFAFLIVCFILHLSLEQIIPSLILSQKALQLSLIVPISILLFTVLAMQILHREDFSLKNWIYIFFNFSAKVLPLVFLMLLGFLCLFLFQMSFFFLEKLPVVGLILSIVFSFVNFFIFLFQGSFSLLFPIFSVFCFDLLIDGKKIEKDEIMKKFFEFSKDPLERLKNFFLSFFPFLFALVLLFWAKNQVINFSEKNLITYEKFLLIFPICFLLAPFVNYFFINWCSLEKKLKN